MQKREKVLAGIFGLTILSWLGLPMIQARFFEPIRQLGTQLDGLKDENDLKFETLKQQMIRAQELSSWQASSLPPNPNNAQRLYHEWLLNIAQLSGLKQVTSTIENPRAEGDAYYTIPVNLKFLATLEQTSLFLQRLDSVDLLHRVAFYDATSRSTEGNPELDVTLRVEGVAMANATDRPRIFAETELFEPLPDDSVKMFVADQIGFPKETPFRIRVGDEFLNVTEISGDEWTVERGAAGTFASNHPDSQIVEYYPLSPVTSPSPNDAEALAVWNKNPFAKPLPEREYNPSLTGSPPTVFRGKNWSWQIQVNDWNPRHGEMKYELINPPEGLKIDAKSGALTWNVSKEAETGERPVEVRVTGNQNAEFALTSPVTLKIRDENQPPQISSSGPLKFYIGRESRVPLPVSDPDNDLKDLKLTLKSGPEGMVIDAASRELRWTPPESLTPQEMTASVEVTDTDPETPLSASADFKIQLEEDSARFAYLTGIMAGGERGTRAMIHDRASGKPSMVVYQGDRFQIADFDVTVEKIEATSLLIKRNDQTYRWEFEQPIVEMTLQEQAQTPATSQSASPADSPDRKETIPVNSESSEEK